MVQIFVHTPFTNTNKYNSVIRQQPSRQHQPRINHAPLIRMKLSVGIGIFEQPIFLFIKHSHLFVFCLLGTHKIVGINKIISGIIRQISKDLIFDTSPVAGKVYKNSENRRKQGVSFGFRCIVRCSIYPVRAQPRYA